MFQKPVEVGEALGHAGFDCAERELEGLGNFVKFEAFVMAKDEHFAMVR